MLWKVHQKVTDHSHDAYATFVAVSMFCQTRYYYSSQSSQMDKIDDCLSTSVVLKAVSVQAINDAQKMLKATCGHSSITCVYDFACSSRPVRSEKPTFLYK